MIDLTTNLFRIAGKRTRLAVEYASRAISVDNSTTFSFPTQGIGSNTGEIDRSLYMFVLGQQLVDTEGEVQPPSSVLVDSEPATDLGEHRQLNVGLLATSGRVGLTHFTIPASDLGSTATISVTYPNTNVRCAVAIYEILGGMITHHNVQTDGGLAAPDGVQTTVETNDRTIVLGGVGLVNGTMSLTGLTEDFNEVLIPNAQALRDCIWATGINISPDVPSHIAGVSLGSDSRSNIRAVSFDPSPYHP